MFIKRTPFEKNWGVVSIFWSETIDLGLYLSIRPRCWIRIMWNHAEADVMWYIVGPFMFYKTGIYS